MQHPRFCELKELHRKTCGLVVFHCNAGMGRTGIVLAALMLC